MISPGRLKTPAPFLLKLSSINAVRLSSTPETSFLAKPVDPASEFKISVFVNGYLPAAFFAITNSSF